MRLLQFSDIHFIDNNSNNQYIQVESDFLADIEDQSKECSFDYILITGDIAYSGKKEQYEKAESFISEICNKVNCSKDNVFVVPGNHDLDREINKDLKEYVRPLLEKKPEAFIKSCKNSVELRHILRALYQPFSNYYSFASKYNCISDFEKAVLNEKDFDSYSLDGSFSWCKEIKDGEISIRVVGVNTALISGCGTKDSKQLLLDSMWTSYKKENEYLNVFMGHHPINDIYNGETIKGDLDSRFQLQISGHRHIQTTSDGKSIKITSAAFEPELSKKLKERQKFFPVYNIIDIKKQDGEYIVKDTPVAWNWDSPGFEMKPSRELLTPLRNKTSLQKKKEAQSANVISDAERAIIMLNNMPYDDRILVVKSAFPGQSISGSTENIEYIVQTAESNNHLPKLVKSTEKRYTTYLQKTPKRKRK